MKTLHQFIKEVCKEFDKGFYRNSNRVWMSRAGESYGSVSPEMGRGELMKFLKEKLLESATLTAGAKEIGEAPVKIMQDGVSMDYSFREGWNAALTEVQNKANTWFGKNENN